MINRINNNIDSNIPKIKVNCLLELNQNNYVSPEIDINNININKSNLYNNLENFTINIYIYKNDNHKSHIP